MSNRNPLERFDYKSWFERNVAKRTVAALEARDAEFAEKSAKYSYGRPFTKESLLYREIFEKYYPGQAEMIVDYWMPNKAWPHSDVNDPSARVLANYGASGQ